jgi:PKD repeat protein
MKYWVTAVLVLTIFVIGGGCSSSAPEVSAALVPVGDTAGAQPPPRAIQGIGEKPVSVPDASPKEGGVPLYVHLWDGGSDDPNGEIVKWEWNFSDAAPGEPAWQDFTDTAGDAWHLYSKPGVKVAHLRVTDNDGNIDVAFVKICMSKDGNANPVAVASADPTSGNAPFTVNFSAAGSYDPDGTIVKYEWDFGEGYGFETSVSLDGGTTHVFETEGVYIVVLRVTDDDGAESMDSVEITVDAPLAIRGDWWMFGREPTHNRRSPFTGPTTNALKWSYALPSSFGLNSPVIGADGTIYVNSYRLFAFNPDGSLKWSNTGINVEGSPAIGADGTVYVGSNDNNLYAINPDGSLKWLYATGAYVYSSPAIDADGTVYVGSLDNKLYAVNPDGSLKWSYTTGGAMPSAPAIGADRTVYVGSEDSKLYAINQDGSLNWSYITGGSLNSSPAIAADGTVYVGSNDGKLYAFGP